MKYYPGTKSRSETRSWISRNLSSYREHGYGMWATFSSSTGEFVGQVGLTLQEVEGHAETELGYLLAREFWGRGIASEAARACRDFAFEKLGRSHLVSLIDPHNRPSRRVAKRIGMHLDRRIGKWGKPICVYSIIRGEVSLDSLPLSGGTRFPGGD